MKTKFTLLFSVVLLLGSQLMAQTYGLFADKPDYKTVGSLTTDKATPNGGWITNSDIKAELVSDGTYFGAEAIKVTMAGKGGGRLYFTSNTKDPEGSGDEGRYVNKKEWNDDYAFLVFYVKLITKCDFRIGYRSLRDGTNVAESDESMAKHGLDTTKINVWQKFILPMKHGAGEFDGHQSTFEKWVSFTIRDRANVGQFLIDEMYVDYRPKTTFGLFADVDKNKLSGSLKTDKRTPKGGVTDDGALSEVVTTGAFGGKEALKVSFFGTGGGRTAFTFNIDDYQGINGSANFKEWNDENAVLVMHTKLLEPMDYRVALWSFRADNNKIDETDESMVSHGLNKTNITDWQKIVVPFTPGMEGRTQDNSKWSAFSLRDRNNIGDFLIDEVYVIYPKGGLNGINNKISDPDFRIRNYPNPANGLTTIEFTIPKAASTSINVYNQIGVKITSLINKNLNAGSHKVNFDATGLPAGLYFYELRSGGFSQTNKMLVD